MIWRAGERAKAQASYNRWYRVAELAEQIHNEPDRAVELAAAISAHADGARFDLVAYSRERLGFIPWLESASNPRPAMAAPQGIWAKIRLGFSAK